MSIADPSKAQLPPCAPLCCLPSPTDREATPQGQARGHVLRAGTVAAFGEAQAAEGEAQIGNWLQESPWAPREVSERPKDHPLA